MKAPRFSLRLMLLVFTLLAVVFATIGAKLQYQREIEYWLELGPPIWGAVGIPFFL